ncbi:NAD(P)H-quinone oxidoreductase [Glutamicibacter mishrai]|uniref:NAD(P)H-quinone oxidoreductase n=1 Tax=Glutamicibacter mishrai TaxID=1775880 RepID=A0A6H0SNM6_9MICC|nr:NAD(P)H-quinone oxidoreductase [Glutamicibacter mishrai]QIV87587.1 NAD(P)H-quinone oxidoreductase [Glutamicibacter mishrai]UTT41338.1 NAD(P)H-quinone oxidoreductase [Glutamicibacter mishrai]
MNAYIYNAGGGPEVIELTERPIPSLGSGEVLVKVEAFGLNRADVQQRKGVYPPPEGASDIPGLEVAGSIVAVGDGASDWSVGTRVAALLAGGGYAQYVNVPTELLIRIPDELSIEEAAALPEVSATVVSNLFIEGGLEQGQTILIHGGAGGIGSMAIQLAKAAGARVFVTASSAEKLAYCQELGADEGINYREEDFEQRVGELTNGQGVDLILDVIGAKYLQPNINALAVNGRLVIIGLQGGTKAEVNLGVMLGKRARVIATTLRSRPLEQKNEIIKQTIARVMPLVDEGKLAINVSKIFDFSDLTSAHEYFDSGEHTGKIVVKA